MEDSGRMYNNVLSANQTRGKKSIAQLTDQKLPKRVYQPAPGQQY